jgi:BirA family biotin operon repressor/biotin-[acetyl-CoA-carboxylase] ligase
LEILRYESVDSTNSKAKRLVANGRPPGFAVMADRQTAGRGRFERIWQTPPGNLAITLTAKISAPTARLPTVALVAGIAIHDALASILEPRFTISIKWPNDILVDGAKISGTLIEADTKALYIGVGLNVTTRPAGTTYPVAALVDHVNTDADAVMRQLVTAWSARYPLWLAEGFGPFLTDYNDRVFGRDREIRFATDPLKTHWVSGFCRGIDSEGRLLIESEQGGVVAYAMGEVGAPL